MATQTDQEKHRRHRRTDREEVIRLQSVVRRLRAEINSLKERLSTTSETQETAEPEPTAAPGSRFPVLPLPDPDGNYPATATLRVILANTLARRREAAGWSQRELAERAKVRPETVSRLETGKHAATVTTVDKIDRALKEAGV